MLIFVSVFVAICECVDLSQFDFFGVLKTWCSLGFAWFCNFGVGLRLG